MYLWPFPIYLNSGKPLGNGINWLKNIRVSIPNIDDNEGINND